VEHETRGRSGGLLLLLAAATVIACRAPRAHPPAAPALPAAPAVVDGPPRPTTDDREPSPPTQAGASPPGCPALDEAKLEPPACDAAVVKTPIPPIVDPTGALAPFHERVLALARGRATDHVRVAMYGDSNLTMDGVTGRLRRHLQARLGDGGHGWVSLARPWAWYRHEDVRHSGSWRHFRQIATSTNPVLDGHYGLANIAAESAGAGAAAWVATAGEGAPVGRSVSRFEVAYLRRPDGGDFDVLVDGQRRRTLTTRGTFEAAFERLEVDDGAHELRVVLAGHGTVRLFGVTMERDAPGVVVDSLGAGALNFEQMARVKASTRTPMVARRGWDLVVFQLGTNLFALEGNKAWVRAVLAEFRAALPGASLLLVTPADTMLDFNAPHSDPRILAVGEQLRELAFEIGVAFWDFRQAMGGDASIRAFITRGLAEPDRVHLTRGGAELMADRMLCALAADRRAYLAARPEAGCR
jgi:lysophospholipase L1-like esterase